MSAWRLVYSYPRMHMIDTAQGEELDKIAELFGIKRTVIDGLWRESDQAFRDQILELLSGPITTSPAELDKHFDPHAGHEIVENFAGGKSFRYCRVCKTEVM